MSTTSSNVDTQERSFGDQVVKMFDCDRQEKQLFCDVIIQARGKRYAVHRAMLGLRCKFFEKLFTSEMKEKYAAVVKIDMDDDRFERILDYCYSGVADISSSNVTDVLDDAEYTELLDLKSECVSRMLQSVDVDNCLKLRSYALRYNLAQVAEKSNRIIEDNFAKIVQQEDFKELELNEVLAILARDRIKTLHEIVYAAIILWVNHNPLSRNQYFRTLFAKVDLSSLSKPFLRSTVSQEVLVRENPECCHAVMDTVVEWLPAQQDLQATSPYVVVIGGDAGCEKQCIKYDITTKERVTLPQLTMARKRATSIKIGNNITTIGGQYEKSCEMINLKDPTNWTLIADLPEVRYYAASSLLDGLIYISGGRDSKDKVTTTCFIYDIVRNIWSNLPGTMLCARNAHAMVTMGDSLYCCGGYDGNKILKSCERYIKNQWSAISDMNEGRSGLAAVVFDGFIYAIGGAGSTNNSSVERYDPKTDKWSCVSRMNKGRWHHVAFVWQGKIYVVGGQDEKSVEVYDPKEDTWTICFDLPCLSNCCTVVAI